MDAMTLLRVLPAVALAWLAVVVVLEDAAESKIRNRHLAAGLGTCAAVYLLQAALTAAGSWGMLQNWFFWGFYWMSLRHLAISLAAGVALWLLNVWPAGDAKLFVVCAVFLPIIRPGLRTFPNYLFLHLLANIFVVAALFLVARGLANVVRSCWRDPLSMAARAAAAARAWAGSTTQDARRWPEWLPTAATTGLLFLLMGILRRAVVSQVGTLVSQPAFLGVVLMLAWERAIIWLRDPRCGAAAAMLGVLALGVIAWSAPAESLKLLRETAFQLTGFGLILWTLRAALERYFLARSRQSVSLADLRPGMILSGETVALLRRDEVFFQENLAFLRRDGLTDEQVLRVREWFLGLPPDKRTLGVARAYPFALWIFIGTLVTLVVSRDAASLLAELLR